MMIARVFLAGLAASLLTLAYDGDSFATKFEALPKAVQETAVGQMDNALPMSISSAKSDQGMEYQINTRLNGKFHNMVIDEKGKLLAVKDETDLASIPGPAKAAIEKEAASSKIVTVEKVTEGSQVSYGAVVRDEAQKTSVQLRVTADGTVQAKKPTATR